MLKFTCLLFALAASTFAYVRYVELPEGHFMQGANSSGLITKLKGTYLEVEWLEDFGYKNSLKVYFNYIFEETGEREIVELQNLCGKYKKGSIADSLKNFILAKLGNTKKCPIKKGTVNVTFPVTFTYNTKSKGCGPAFGFYNIFRNNKTDSKRTPLQMGLTFRGVVYGDDC